MSMVIQAMGVILNGDRMGMIADCHGSGSCDCGIGEGNAVGMVCDGESMDMARRTGD